MEDIIQEIKNEPTAQQKSKKVIIPRIEIDFDTAVDAQQMRQYTEEKLKLKSNVNLGKDGTYTLEVFDVPESELLKIRLNDGANAVARGALSGVTAVADAVSAVADIGLHKLAAPATRATGKAVSKVAAVGAKAVVSATAGLAGDLIETVRTTKDELKVQYAELESFMNDLAKKVYSFTLTQMGKISIDYFESDTNV
jgi:hypothetical protein